MTVKRRSPGPGLAKAGAHPLLLRRHLETWRSSDYRWRELFERADVMSEGAVRNESDGRTYYGTTSVLLPYASNGGLVPDELGWVVGRLVSRDVHARVRAIRIACREAQVRSASPIGRVRAEFVVRPDPRGIRVDIEVEARVIEQAPARTVVERQPVREQKRKRAGLR